MTLGVARATHCRRARLGRCRAPVGRAPLGRRPRAPHRVRRAARRRGGASTARARASVPGAPRAPAVQHAERLTPARCAPSSRRTTASRSPSRSSARRSGRRSSVRSSAGRCAPAHAASASATRARTRPSPPRSRASSGVWTSPGAPPPPPSSTSRTSPAPRATASPLGAKLQAHEHAALSARYRAPERHPRRLRARLAGHERDLRARRRVGPSSRTRSSIPSTGCVAASAVATSSPRAGVRGRYELAPGLTLTPAIEVVDTIAGDDSGGRHGAVDRRERHAQPQRPHQRPGGVPRRAPCRLRRPSRQLRRAAEPRLDGASPGGLPPPAMPAPTAPELLATPSRSGSPAARASTTATTCCSSTSGRWSGPRRRRAIGTCTCCRPTRTSS